jgi:hypothetical protein
VLRQALERRGLADDRRGRLAVRKCSSPGSQARQRAGQEIEELLIAHFGALDLSALVVVGRLIV